MWAGAEMKIRVNGNPCETESIGLYDLRKELGAGGENLVVILNGYQTQEDIAIHGGDEIVLIQKGELPPQEAMEAMLCARHTPGVYEKVKAAHVAVAGLGGLGSQIALALARTGVGNLHLIDFDVVEPSNLNRQQYRICHLGMPKAQALLQEIGEINPYVCVTAERLRLTEQNCMDTLRGDDIICEAFDVPEAKAMLVNTVLAECPEKYVVSASGMAGYGSGNEIRTRRVMKNLYVCGDGETGAKPGCGLMAPRVGICAGHQANMVLRIILNELEA